MVDRLNTRNMLRGRHYIVADNNYSCMLCDNPLEETLLHLFFKCSFCVSCWALIVILWPDVNCRFQMIHAAKAIWSRLLFVEVFTIAAWSIWKERNNKYFMGIAHSLVSWKNQFKSDFAKMVHRTKESSSSPHLLLFCELLYFSVGLL